MNIITVGNSPFNLTSNSHIHAQLIGHFIENGDNVLSIAWDHVESYYIPSPGGQFFYDPNGEIKCPLIPIDKTDTNKVISLYEVIKIFGPDALISIGDISEVEFISAIKSMYPNILKWISILLPTVYPIKKSDSIDFMDSIICTNKYARGCLNNITPVTVNYCPVSTGTDGIVSYEESDKFKILFCGKNSQISNIASVIQAVSGLDNVEAYFHTNISDIGDYDLEYLKSVYDKNDIVKFPDEFISFYDGIEKSDLLSKFSNYDVIVDASMYSPTGLSVLEAMSCGCIPLISDYLALSDILDKYEVYEKGICNLVGNDFISNGEGVVKIVGANEIFEKLNKIIEIKRGNKEGFYLLKRKSIEIAEYFNRFDFANTVSDAVESVCKNKKLNLVLENLF